VSDALRDPELAYQQALVYAEELGDLYRRNRAGAAELQAAREVEERIRLALEGGVLGMVFQPVANLMDGRVVGLEALARFTTTPQRPPNIWFEEAALVGLQEELELAASFLALWHLEQMPADAFLSVNLSPATMLSPIFRDIFRPHNMARVVLEVTEHAPVGDYGLLKQALRWFRASGGRLAVDDAGAGFASLRHILSLEPDFIKIDISLTRDINRDPGRRALARALISFAADIGAVIIAEGIETQGEVETLQELGVLFGQGYWLGRPGPLEALQPTAP
jgi:EAL domain-containing protein (putative c-di-GMP-specific phosphodiesterase class I)